MAELELIQQRFVSGKGVVRIPGDVRKNRLLVLYCDVIRHPKSEYLNFNYLPSRSRYGFVNFLRNDYVISTASIEYPRQSFDGITDVTGQNLIAIKCAYEGILQSFANLGTALGVVPISIIDLIKDYEYLNLSWDEARISCYADTALQIRLYRLIHDTCNPDKDKDKRPPPPPPPRPPVPPGTPIEDIDDPYEGDPVTEPYPGDGTPPPPPLPEFPECAKVGVRWRPINASGTQYDYRYNIIYAYYGGMRLVGDNAIEIFSRGIDAAPGVPESTNGCVPTAKWYQVDFSPTGGFVGIEIDSVLEIP